MMRWTCRGQLSRFGLVLTVALLALALLAASGASAATTAPIEAYDGAARTAVADVVVASATDERAESRTQPGDPGRYAAPSVRLGIATEAESGAALDATPAGRPYSAHYLTDTGPVRNIPGSVVDETIDYGSVAKDLPDRTVYYNPENDVTVVESKTTGKIMSVRRGAP